MVVGLGVVAVEIMDIPGVVHDIELFEDLSFLHLGLLLNILASLLIEPVAVGAHNQIVLGLGECIHVVRGALVEDALVLDELEELFEEKLEILVEFVLLVVMVGGGR
jgi:hypothetical protein